jgi:hypothetical protein
MNSLEDQMRSLMHQIGSQKRFEKYYVKKHQISIYKFYNKCTHTVKKTNSEEVCPQTALGKYRSMCDLEHFKEQKDLFKGFLSTCNFLN